MQSVVWDLGWVLLSLVDPVLRTLLRSSTALRSAQDDTRGHITLDRRAQCATP